MQKSPYKFLDSYSKEDRDIFFGREKETDEMFSRVFESRILLVYGTSGTGKSSLINCGLANRFNESDWLPVTVRRGSNINRSLFDSLEKQSIEIREKSADKGHEKNILKLIQSVYLDHFKPLFLIFDQFEELFIFGSTEEKEELINNIKKVVDSDLQCRFIFSIREEYLAGVTEFEKVIPSFLSNRIRIERMTRQNAKRVIEGPCQVNEISLEENFADMLLEKLNPASTEVELTWLQVYLDRVFRLASGSRGEVKGITNDLLEKAGEVKDLLGSFLEEQISQLDDPDSGLIILKSFVSVKGTRVQITGKEVIEYTSSFGHDLPSEKVKDLIQKFVSLRILRDKDENGRYELRHDSLAAKIYEKITLVEKEILEVRQFLDHAYNSYEKRGLYLSAEDLKYIAPFEELLFLNEKVQKFISQSKWSLHKARRRRQRILVSFTVIIITVLSLFTAWALHERNNAKHQGNLAEERRIQAEAERATAVNAKIEADNSRKVAEREKSLADSNEIVALRNAEEATRQKEFALIKQTEAERNEAEAKRQEQIANEQKRKADAERSEALRLRRLAAGKAISIKSLQLNGEKELQSLLAYQAYLFNSRNGGYSNDADIYQGLHNVIRQYGKLNYKVFAGHEGEINSIAFIPGSNDFFASGGDGRLLKWTFNGSEYKMTEIFSNQELTEVIAVSPDGSRLACGGINSTIKVLQINEGDTIQVELNGHTKQVSSLFFSDDGKYLWSSALDGKVLKWDLRLNSFEAMGPKDSQIISIDKSPDGKYLAGITPGGEAIVWNPEIGSGQMNIETPGRNIKTVRFSNDGSVLAIGYYDGYLELRKIPDNKIIAQVNAHSSVINAIRFNNNGQMATASNDKTVKIWDLADMTLPPVVIKENNQFAMTTEFSPDSRYIIIGSYDGPNNLTMHATEAESLAAEVSSMLTRNLTPEEWSLYIGNDVEYEKVILK